MTKTQYQDQPARTADIELITLDQDERGESLSELEANVSLRPEGSAPSASTQFMSRRERRDAERADEARLQAEALTEKWNLAAANAAPETATEWDDEIPATFRAKWAPRRSRLGSSVRRVSGSMLGVSLIAGTAVVGAGSAAFAAVSAPEAEEVVAAPTAPIVPETTAAPETEAPQAASATVSEETSVTAIDPEALAGMAVEPEPVVEVEVAPTPASTQSAVAPASASIVWPVSEGSGISSGFGPRSSPTAGASSNHEGVDFVPGAGTAVGSMADGKVTNVDYGSTSYGIYVDVEHTLNGQTITTRYAHLQGADVSVGESVSAGQRLGAVGSTGVSTGAHLHFEVHVGGSPVDPIAYLQQHA